ncbi:MAG TPA: hypothetical protein VIP46_03750, partial [Pyrinomonadaceae bacterium]
RAGERGAALATALILLVLMGIVAASIVAVATAEVSVASEDLQQMRTYQCTQAHLEHMTNQFSDLFQKTNSPTASQLNQIASAAPAGLASEGFSFVNPSLALDSQKLAIYRARSTSTTSAWPTVVLPPGSTAFAGLFASLVPYRMRSTCHFDATGTEVTLEREINSYLIPLFQFGMFSDGDIELHPGPAFTFNGRIHANGNVYLNGDVTLLNKVTTANEIVTDVIRNGSTRSGANVRAIVGGVTAQLTQGSAEGGPNFGATSSTQRGYAPDSPTGAPDPNWDTNSTLPAAAGVPNRFGGQIVTRSTGATKLKLPLELGGNPTREIIKRRMPNDDATLSEGRYHTKAKLRILIDDEGPTSAAGIPAGAGVTLSTFRPLMLGNGRALWRVDNNGSYVETASTATQQPSLSPCSSSGQADTVRSVKSPTGAITTADCSPNNRMIPRGAGIRGRVLIQIIDANGVARDVTQQILSMGMTVGEPNAILHFQRPMWAAFLQGSRDRTGTSTSLNQLVNIVNNSNLAADGEIRFSASLPVVDPTTGFLTQVQDETGSPSRAPTPWPTPATHVSGTFNPGMWNSIVPINVYNIREGWINSGLAKQNVYERGITQVVEINMRNLVRWLDGVYDSNLLSGTPAASGNIDAPDGYVIYFSDRRGDSIKQEQDSSGAVLATTNGTVDNEDIYGPNNSLDPGEDVIDHGPDLASGGQKKGTLQVDLCELPSPAVFPAGFPIPATLDNRLRRAREVSQWSNVIPTANACGPAGTARFFRSAVRIFNGENLRTTGAAGRLSATKGITFATENMLYLWGNYNTTGINTAPAGSASSINDCSVAGASCYLGNQVPASIVCDAIFPLSKTWFDASSALFPEGDLTRMADANALGVTDETSVRSGIVAGNNLSAMSGTPDAGNGADSRMSGGMHNFPRFLENWASPQKRWNFTGSFVPLYRSTQAMGQWNYWDSYVIYGAPIRNWSFDTTFTDPSKLPPGTPTFQYIEPTGFRPVGY